MTKLKQIYQFYIKKCFICNLIFLSVLFFAHCFWGNMMYIVFPVLAVMVALDNLENSFSYLIFSLPFCMLNVYISVMLYLVCCIIFIIRFYIAYFFKRKNKLNFSILISIAIFVIYSILPIGEYNLNKFIKIFIFLVIFIAFIMIIRKNEVFRGHFNIKLICLSLIVASLFSLTYLISPYLKDYMIILPLENNLTRFMALFVHPNVFAMFSEVLLSLLAYFIISKKGNHNDIFLFAAIAFLGLLTFSKTYLIILFIILAFLTIWCFTQNSKKTILVLIYTLSLALLVCLILPNVISNFLNRFLENISESVSFKDFLNKLTTGRVDLWIEYLSYIFNNPLVLFFGRGFGAQRLNLLSTHNAYISIIYQLGIVGTILFVQVLFIIFREFFKKKTTKPHWAIIIPILTLALIFVVEDLIFFIFE